MNRTFMSLYRDEIVNSEMVDDFIEEWHSANSQESLADYLGMTTSEYEFFAITGELPE